MGKTSAESKISIPSQLVEIPSPPPRYSRRLSDKILIAFHQACDQGDYEIAERLLHLLEIMVVRRTPHPDANRRKSMDGLVAAYERLWCLRHPESFTAG